MKKTYAFSQYDLPWADVVISSPKHLKSVPRGVNLYVVGNLSMTPYEAENFYFECRNKNITIRRASLGGIPID